MTSIQVLVDSAHVRVPEFGTFVGRLISNVAKELGAARCWQVVIQNGGFQGHLCESLLFRDVDEFL